MAGQLRLELSGAHGAALADFRGMIEELLVRDWSKLVLGGGTVLAMHWNHRHGTVRGCRSIAQSRKGRRTGRPVLGPSDPGAGPECVGRLRARSLR